jgi:hypothetical protein
MVTETVQLVVSIAVASRNGANLFIIVLRTLKVCARDGCSAGLQGDGIATRR